MTDDVTAAPRIVVGVDGSDPSKAALWWAVREAGLIGGVVEAVAVWEYPTAWYGWTPPQAEVFDYEKNARRTLVESIDRAIGPDRPVEIHTRVVQGHPAAVLLDAARGARLLVVGNRGHGGFAQALLGSVGQHCAQHASCPVVIVRGPGEASND
ncbi:universal stress protein [Kitasatospora sp. NBC_01287]|uniref:universal stress protein n=1 Tax=Kitasatospora sp. NBC_01287 TaxID=2903573 RepID=UPI00224FC4F7|nr:universal stress protein [Kitasatospora sp. NBC_01287]MCX4744769.1 universal stress protein [Kitasatospora sp. NBC_01287]